MAFIQRYSDVKKGGIVFTGNTLGLSKASNQNAPGTEGSIGAFTSLNAALQVGTFPMGTTLNYLQNGSAANLTLLAGSTVLYAELVWGGLFRSSVNNISALIDNNVTFTTPLGSSSIAPDAATAQTFNIPSNDITVGFYVRSANVTPLVQSSLNGTYSVEGVPALIEALDNRTSDTNHAGWTLAVVYENPTLPLRNLTVWSGGAVVSPSAGSTTITVSDFLTPEVPPITGKIFVSAQEGDAVLTGDQMLFGQTVPTLTALSGPNNPLNNFFASQINNENGTLDTSGTFGTRNANAAAGTNTSACRQGWDITAIDVSGELEASQSSAVIRFTTDGDLYVPNLLALQIDSKGADLSVVKSADKTYAEVGEEITYTLNITNTGTVDALNVTVNDMLPPETTLVPNSITVDGAAYAGTLPVVISSIAPNASVTVAFKVTVGTFPVVNPIFNIARADFEFFPFAGYSATSFSNSNPVAVFIIVRQAANVKSVDKAIAKSGDVLTYTSVIQNTGTVPITDVIFTDPIPTGTTFLNGSVVVDGVSYPAYNPEVGFFAANLTPQAVTTVTFKVTINEGVTMNILNQSNVAFNYVLPNEQTIPDSLDSNVVTTRITIDPPTPDRRYISACACCHFVSDDCCMPCNRFAVCDYCKPCNKCYYNYNNCSNFINYNCYGGNRCNNNCRMNSLGNACRRFITNGFCHCGNHFVGNDCCARCNHFVGNDCSNRCNHFVDNDCSNRCNRCYPYHRI